MCFFFDKKGGVNEKEKVLFGFWGWVGLGESGLNRVRIEFY